METKTEAKHYTASFYMGHEKGSFDSAKAILPIVQKLLNPKSIIDVGCGIGLWLKVWKDELNVDDIHGIEGDYVNGQMLSIPTEFIQVHDLKKPLSSHKKYDLAMSLEVAEHLPPQNAGQFVETLVSLSDTILFSAAMVGQEGTFHLNEQMPEYWAEKFLKYDFVPIDYIRSLIWNKPEVMYWYKQNTLLFIHKSKIASLPHELAISCQNTKADCLLRIHPDQYFKVLKRKNIGSFIHYRLYRIKKFLREKR